MRIHENNGKPNINIRFFFFSGVEARNYFEFYMFAKWLKSASENGLSDMVLHVRIQEDITIYLSTRD